MGDSIYNKRDWLERFMNDRSPDTFDRERLSKISEAIPGGVKTVLDIGFGGGYIFRELKDKKGLNCFGMDISLELAGKLKDNKICVGDAVNIPFKDGVFDLVFAGDLIEHIKEESFRTSISEIIRASGRYILINSPYKDAVDWPVSLCGSCGREFNVYGHIRTVNMGLLRDLFPADRFDLISARVLGKKRDPRPSLFVHIARRWGKVYSQEGAICPHCFSNRICKRSRNIFERFTGKTVAAIFFIIDNLIPPALKSGGEVLVLLKKRTGRTT